MAIVSPSSIGGRNHIGPVIATGPDGTRVMECLECGFMHQADLPSPSDIEAYYSTDAFYNTHSPRDHWAHEESQRDYWTLVYADYLDTLARYTDKPVDEPLTILDVGCGSGLLLHVAMHKGWQGTGIEPSPQARARTDERGVYVVPTLDGIKMQFDAAAMLLVLEHVLDPLAMLRTVRERLVENGVLLIVTPNDFNPLQDVVRKVYNLPTYWICKPHISYFTPDSLDDLVERAGFTVRQTSTTYPIEQHLLAGKMYIGNEELGRQCFRERMAFETALYEHGQKELLHWLQECWVAMNIGREVVMMGVKR